MYTDISTVMISHIVLNDNQWSVGFVVDTNDLTTTDKYQQRVLKQLTEARRKNIQYIIYKEKKYTLRLAHFTNIYISLL